MAKRRRKSHKSCLVTSGKKKGKPRKGFRLGKGGRCIAAKKKGKKSHKRRSKR